MSDTKNALAPAGQLPAISMGGRVQGLIPQSFDEAWRLAQAMHKGGVGMAGEDGALAGPEKLMVAIMTGMELGVPPMAAVSSIAVINGKPSVFGDLALGLVQNSGLLESIEEWEEGRPPDALINTPKWTDVAGVDAWTAFCKVKRRGEPEITRKFSIGDYRRADKLGTDKKTPVKTYPQRMIQMRARAWALRDKFADILKGVGIREEQEDIERTARDVTPRGTVVDLGGKLRNGRATQEAIAAPTNQDGAGDDGAREAQDQGSGSQPLSEGSVDQGAVSASEASNADDAAVDGPEAVESPVLAEFSTAILAAGMVNDVRALFREFEEALKRESAESLAAASTAVVSRETAIKAAREADEAQAAAEGQPEPETPSRGKNRGAKRL